MGVLRTDIKLDAEPEIFLIFHSRSANDFIHISTSLELRVLSGLHSYNRRH